jgi:tagaturonate reductase
MNPDPTERQKLPPLSRDLIESLRSRSDLLSPPRGYEAWPEAVVQFGTGAFLRGFVEYFLDQAGRSGDFPARVVMVGSTGSGRDRVVGDQDGLYTLYTRGISGGEVREERRIVGVVSRALSAATEWEEVLACARNPELKLIFSNTTEVGIRLDPDDAPSLSPPHSYPGKLARFLFERARAFDFDARAGVVVIPCELIENNGGRLRDLVLELGERWGFGASFRRWISDAVPFCNTLVDRIVPGAPTGAALTELEQSLGYRDELLTTTEVYRLFAIEGDEALREQLRFAAADSGVLVTPDIAPYRERKVRLLNGGHTVMVPAALLAGCRTVREAVEHEQIGPFLRRVLLEEIVPAIDAPGSAEFANEVLDRFANPFIEHSLFDITLHGTAKMKVRVVPSIVSYSERFGRVPECLAFGFAAFLLFMRGELHSSRVAAGETVPADDAGERIRSIWDGLEAGDAPRLMIRVSHLCADAELWGADLTQVPGFVDAVSRFLDTALREGTAAALEAHLPKALSPRHT